MTNIKGIFEKNAKAKVGDTVTCPGCGSKFVKTTYHQKFCKSKPGTQCKDKYYNTVTPTKRNNTTRISPASAIWLAKNDTPVIIGFGSSQRALDREDREFNELNAEGGEVYVERCHCCDCINCRCDF